MFVCMPNQTFETTHTFEMISFKLSEISLYFFDIKAKFWG